MRRLLLVLLLSACHDHDHSSYSTFQACFDEHTMEESLSVMQAIVVCCLDHPIDGVSEVCGTTATACVDYLTANLAATSASDPDRTAACDEYVRQRGQ